MLLVFLVTADAVVRILQDDQYLVVLVNVLILVLLFTITFMQLSTHIDSFQFDHSFAAEPIHWLLFALGNALRAADLADVLKDYGVYVPQITPRGWMACILVVAYRSIVDLLFIGFALRTLKRVGESIRDVASSMVDLQVCYFGVCALFLMIWVPVVVWWTPWTASNQVLWLLDNFLRVIDIFDVMQIFGLRLDAVHSDVLERMLGIWFRLLIALALAAPLSKQQDRIGEWLRSKWGNSSDSGATTSPRTRYRLLLAGCAVIVFSVALFIVDYNSPATHQQLTRLALQSDKHAHAIVRRLGINCAANTMHPLHELAVDASRTEQERLQAIKTLAFFRAPSADLLVDCIRQQPALGVRMIDSITRAGPSASVAMVALMGENDLPVRRRALEQLRQWGSDSIFFLSSEITDDTVTYYYSLFDIIDPQWDRSRGTGEWFRQLLGTKRSFRDLQQMISELRSSTSFKDGRAAEQSIERICREMSWSPPGVAEELVQLEAFLNSEQFKQLKNARLENDVRSRFAGRSRYAGVDARHQSDPVEDAKKHLTGLVKRYPGTAIDVFWLHHRSGDPVYVDSAAVCFRDVLGHDFEAHVRNHLRRPLHHRLFDVDAAPLVAQWSAPDVRQVLIDAQLVDVADLDIPPWPRAQLSVDDAVTVEGIIADASTEVWIDVIDELQRRVYPVDFVKQLTTSASRHEAADVRRRVARIYADLPDGQEILQQQLSLETDASVLTTLIEVASDSELLLPTLISSLTRLAETESEMVSAAVTKLLTNEKNRDIDLLVTLANRFPHYEEQLKRQVEALTSVEELSGFLLVGPESSRCAALHRLVDAGPDGHGALIDRLTSVATQSEIGERSQWLGDAVREQYPKLFDSDSDVDANEVVLSWKRLVALCVSMLDSDQVSLRHSAIDLLRGMTISLRRKSLSFLYRRLKIETDTALRRKTIELFVTTPPQGINGVIAWRKQESDPDLIRYMDEILENHKSDSR